MPFGFIPDSAFGFAGIPSSTKTNGRGGLAGLVTGSLWEVARPPPEDWYVVLDALAVIDAIVKAADLERTDDCR